MGRGSSGTKGRGDSRTCDITICLTFHHNETQDGRITKNKPHSLARHFFVILAS